MTETTIELTEDEFDERFPLVENHLNPAAGWVLGDSRGCLFETYGEELAFVRSQHPDRVWTLVDGDDGGLYLVNGLHFVNRIGYLVARVPLARGVSVVVRIETPDNDPEAEI